MTKCYIKIDNEWVRVYRINDWYDLLSWACLLFILATVGILTWRHWC